MLLNANRDKVPGQREQPVDGLVSPSTITAIREFQGKVLGWKFPDGLVEPNGKTITALIGIVPSTNQKKKTTSGHADPVPASNATPALTKKITFPLGKRPKSDYHVPENLENLNAKGKWHHHRYFGAPRSDKKGGFRAHAGCDLIASPGARVYAVADGTVMRYERRFFQETDAVSVRHDSSANGIVVRYAEISVLPAFRAAGAIVKRGQQIGTIVANNAGSSMLHIEFYTGKETGSALSVLANSPFRRRADLIDGTIYLDEAILRN